MNATELHVTLIPGLSRTGKTTLALRYLNSQFAADASCVFFVFDPLGVMAAACGFIAAETADECLAALDTERFCFFDSSLMFPGDRTAGFEWFARWSYALAQSRTGRKVLFVDEVWRHCSPHQIPQALAEWVQDGAKWGCECVFVTQTPSKLHGSITGQLTEVIAFRLQERAALEFMEGLGFDANELRALQPGSFVALNLFSGAELRARLW